MTHRRSVPGVCRDLLDLWAVLVSPRIIDPDSLPFIGGVAFLLQQFGPKSLLLDRLAEEIFGALSHGKRYGDRSFVVMARRN